MRKYIVVILLMVFMVVIGINQIQSQLNTKTETKNKDIVAKEKNVCNNMVEAEVKYEPEYILMQASAYTKSIEEGTHKGITRSGTQVSRGTVAVDPRVIPLGTKVYIEGYGHAECLDTGGAIKGNRIDLYMETKEEAFEFGRRQVKVYILDGNRNKI